MARTPNTPAPKIALQADVSIRAYQGMRNLYQHSTALFASFSQLVEAVLFLSLHAYYERPDDAFARSLLQIKAMELLDLGDLRAPRKTKRVHVTVDPEAHRFLVELAAHYPALFSGKSEALELIFIHAARMHVQHAGYLAQRLEDVMRIHARPQR